MSDEDRRLEAVKDALVCHSYQVGLRDAPLFHRLAELLKDLRVYSEARNIPWENAVKDAERRYCAETQQGDA